MSDLVARLLINRFLVIIQPTAATISEPAYVEVPWPREAGLLIEQQATKIAELEHLLSLMTSSRDGYAKQDAARLAEARRLALEEAITIVEAHDQDWPAGIWIAGRIAAAILSLKKGEQA